MLQKIGDFIVASFLVGLAAAVFFFGFSFLWAILVPAGILGGIVLIVALIQMERDVQRDPDDPY